MVDLKNDWEIIKDDLTTITIKEEVIEELENLECDLAFTAEMAAIKRVDDSKIEPIINLEKDKLVENKQKENHG